MNPASLAISSIVSRPLQTILCVISAAAGIALVCFILLMSQGIDNGIGRNMRGIDMVVGAKGSPLQLILSTVFHADVPNGNIEQTDADTITRNPQVAKAIPIAVGDSYKGYRVVGSSADYISLFHGEAAQGRIFNQNFEAVVGANVRVPLNTEFAAVHGLSIDSDDVHNYHLYRVVGVLKPTGTVLDRLIVTTLGSVQELHSHADADDPDAAEEMALGHQLTALLVKVRNPVSVMNLPRMINKSSNMLAVSPSYELTRFSQTMGISRDVLLYIGAGFLILSALTLLSSLSSSLAARRYDLGVLRSMGTTRGQIWATVMLEGLVIALTGAVTGVIAGHIFAYTLSSSIETLNGLILPEDLLKPGTADLGLIILGGFLGLIAGLVPARLAAKTDVAELLARGRI